MSDFGDIESDDVLDPTPPDPEFLARMFVEKCKELSGDNMQESRKPNQQWVTLLLLALTCLQSIGMLKIIMFLLKERSEISTRSSNERTLLMNKLMSRDPMTYQILSQEPSPNSHSPEREILRNDDESELEKINWVGDGEVLIDMTQDYRDLGIIGDD